MKIRVISFFEVEDKIKEVILELDRRPMDEGLVLTKAGELRFLLGVCLSQMSAVNSADYPEKSKHKKILQSASEDITYKLNSCTIEEATVQVKNAYMAFGEQ